MGDTICWVWVALMSCSRSYLNENNKKMSFFRQWLFTSVPACTHIHIHMYARHPSTNAIITPKDSFKLKTIQHNKKRFRQRHNHSTRSIRLTKIMKLKIERRTQKNNRIKAREWEWEWNDVEQWGKEMPKKRQKYNSCFGKHRMQDKQKHNSMSTKMKMF